MSKNPAPPRGTKTSGRRLWTSILADFELEEHELALLREAVRTVDQLDTLHEIVEKEGPVLSGKAHPALVESRQLRIVLTRIVASLRLPEGESDDRPQRRGSARAPYRPRSLAAIPGGA